MGTPGGQGSDTGPAGVVAATEMPAPPSLRDVAASLGFRRVLFVRVVVGSGRTRAFVTGVVRRSVRTVPVPLAAAARLAAAGAIVRIVEDVEDREGFAP